MFHVCSHLRCSVQLKYGVDESYTLDVPKNGDPAIIKVRETWVGQLHTLNSNCRLVLDQSSFAFPLRHSFDRRGKPCLRMPDSLIRTSFLHSLLIQSRCRRGKRADVILFSLLINQYYPKYSYFHSVSLLPTAGRDRVWCAQGAWGEGVVKLWQVLQIGLDHSLISLAETFRVRDVPISYYQSRIYRANSMLTYLVLLSSLQSLLWCRFI